MKDIVEKSAVELGKYIIKNKVTVRKAAKKFGVIESTVHKDIFLIERFYVMVR